MKVFHDTRDCAYRKPYGAVAVGTQVTLTVDVLDSPGAKVELRTWEDGVGETLYEMQPTTSEHFEVAFVPNAPGIVWYQFVITDTQDYVWRYGARNGCVGGQGQLVGWEPPSFGLAVFDSRAEAPVWHGPIAAFLHDDAMRHNTPELVSLLLEMYPFELCRTATPWDVDAASQSCAPVVTDMGQALEKAQADGLFEWFSVGEDVFGFWCRAKNGAMTCALFNASPHETREVFVPMVGEEVSELVAGYAVPVVDMPDAQAGADGPSANGKAARVFLWQFGSALLHFHGHDQLACPMEEGLGVLAHITSLPTGDGQSGTLGAPARAFVDWLSAAGVKYWQVLPVSPTDEYGSPYAGISAFAGNVSLLEGDADSAAARAVAADPEGYRAFCDTEADWLEPYACFMAIRGEMGEGKAWQEWPKKYRTFNPSLVRKNDALAKAAEACRRRQFAFNQQWNDVRAYANERGIKVIGDMPIYVSSDSADVWAHSALFQLDRDGAPSMVAGCPPDAFAAEGQIWGNPVYDWGAAWAEGYAWWLRRLQRAFDLYDYVRLDHFIGFSRYFSIPVGEKALAGSFQMGPGFDFFRMAHEKLGQLPVIAEDLGLLTPRVRALVADCGFPGMDIIQFADGGDPLASYEPRPQKIVYTGTHDNQTLLGFVRGRYPEKDENEAFETIISKVVESAAPVRILPLQDVLGLDDEARMNVPGIAEGNWAWQADDASMKRASGFLRKLVERG